MKVNRFWPQEFFFRKSKGAFREGNGTPLQYSCLENPWTEEPGRLQSMGSLSRTRLRDFTFTFHFHTLEKEMATHSSVLAWRIPGTGEHGGLPSMGSHRVGHDWSDLAAAAAAKELYCTTLTSVLGLFLSNSLHCCIIRMMLNKGSMEKCGCLRNSMFRTN